MTTHHSIRCLRHAGRLGLVLLLSPLAIGEESETKPEAVKTVSYPEATVVVFNSASEESKSIAEYYSRKRQIPPENLVGLKTADAETISRQEFNVQINEPLRAHFTEKLWWKLQDTAQGKMCVETNKRVIVIIRGIPLRISAEPVLGNPDPASGNRPVIPQPAGQENSASVDSELAVFGLIDRAMNGALQNPYFQKNESFGTLPLAPFFLTGRLDGPEKSDVIRLIDDALAVEKEGLYGKVYIDLALKNEAGYKIGEDWLLSAAKSMGLSGFPVIVDSQAGCFPENFPMRDCAYYLGWYTIPPNGPFLNPDFKFKRGAVACHIHSFSATSLRNPKEAWLAPMIKQGVCAAIGNCWEPYLGLTSHLDILTDRLLRGYTLAEAHAMSQPGWSWMQVCVGDPLYRPFAAPIDIGKNDPEYRALRLAMMRWGAPEKQAEMLQNLEKAAGSLKSGALWESLVLIGQGIIPDEGKRIEGYFTKASAAYKNPADKLRLELLKANMLRAASKNKDATKILEKAVKDFAKIPEVKAAQEWLAQMKSAP